MLQRIFRGNDAAGHLGADPAPAGISPRMRVALVVSAALHLAVALILLLGLPSLKQDQEEPAETTVAMVFQGPVQAPTRAAVPAPAPSPPKEAASPEPPVTEPPKPQPVEAPPPPPAPPQQPAAATPPLVPPPPVPPPASEASVPPPAPRPPVRPPAAEQDVSPVIPPPPRAPPPPPAPAPAKVELPLPLPPPKVPSPPSPPSPTAQPNATKNPAPNSSSIANTLEKLRQQLAQAPPPKSRSSPQSAGQPTSGGNPLSNDTAALSASQNMAIGEQVRECWTKDAGALDIDKQRVLVTVTTDAGGVARKAEVTGSDAARMGDPRFRVFAERAIRAILAPRCASLPLPATFLGRVNVLTFRFSP